MGSCISRHHNRVQPDVIAVSGTTTLPADPSSFETSDDNSRGDAATRHHRVGVISAGESSSSADGDDDIERDSIGTDILTRGQEEVTQAVSARSQEHADDDAERREAIALLRELENDPELVQKLTELAERPSNAVMRQLEGVAAEVQIQAVKQTAELNARVQSANRKLQSSQEQVNREAAERHARVQSANRKLRVYTDHGLTPFQARSLALRREIEKACGGSCESVKGAIFKLHIPGDYRDANGNRVNFNQLRKNGKTAYGICCDMLHHGEGRDYTGGSLTYWERAAFDAAEHLFNNANLLSRHTR